MLGRKKINKYGKPYICVVVEEDHQVSKDYKRKEDVAQASMMINPMQNL